MSRSFLLLTGIHLLATTNGFSAILEVPSGYPNIQAAVVAAAPGDTIQVSPGNYTENISINKNLTLQSTGGRAVTTLTGVSGVGSLGAIVVTNNTTAVTIGGTGKGFKIIGIDNGDPALENAAVYFQGGHTGVQVIDNEIQANGDGGLLSEFGMVVSNWLIDSNLFSGQTFVGPNPADFGFANQFSTPNVPRQLVLIGNGGGNLVSATATNITFTNNVISGVAGGINVSSQEQGNQLVTLDVASSTITGNTFQGTTTRFAGSLRVRRPGTTISGNTFVSTGLGINTSQLFVQNNTTPLQTIAAANTFDKGVYLDNSTTVGLSIQGFVTAVSAGTTINVLPGSYSGNISINKNLTLQSTGGRAATTLTGVSGVGSLGTIVVTNNTTAVTIGGSGKGFKIIGIDNGDPGLENAAVYFQGGHTGVQVIDNEIQANGDGGLLSEFGMVISNWLIDSNLFSGQTFVGPNPADFGFANQFSTPNVPRQLVLIGNGGGNLVSATATNITFTNNVISGLAGGINVSSQEQGNQLVTLDVASSTITGNTFQGTTTRFAGSLRVRRPGTTISGNTFVSTGLGINTSQLFVQNNTTPLQTIAAANTFDKGVYLNNSTTIGLSIQSFVAGVPSGTQINVLSGTYAENVTAVANSVILAPGTSTGKIVINGSLTLDANDSLAFDIHGATAGVGYDQWEVAGPVTLGGASSSFAGTYSVLSGQTFALVNNDLADAVTGIFSGLPEGSTIPNFIGSGLPAQINYTGGSGNDVVLTILGVSLVGPDLVIESPSGSGTSNDSLTIAINGPNLRLSDPNNALFAGPGAVQIDANTIEIPVSLITGSIILQGTGGDDVLTLDFSSGNPLPPGGLTFNGGSGNDALRVLGNGQSVVYSPDVLTDGNGSIQVGGRLLTFTGLEPIDFVGVALTLSLPGANDIVELANGFLIDGTTPAVLITGTSGGIGFENARVRSSSIVIDTTGVAGTDAITVTSLDNAHLNTSLTLTTGTEAGDTITVNGTTTVTGTTTLNAKTIALNADVTNAVSGSLAMTITVASLAQIQDGINVAAATGAIVQVAAGSYAEDIVIDRSLTLRGAGAATTSIVGPIGGPRAVTVLFTGNASNSILEGFTVTRAGNNPTDWTNASLNTVGISIQFQTLSGITLRNNIVTGNRNGIDINDSNGHSILNNVVSSNRTGLFFRNQTDNLVVEENAITGNHTAGILFFPAVTNGTFQQTALNSSFRNNNISGNWYGQVQERQAGGVIPPPGTTNLKNFSGNWFGTATPTIVSTNGTEPGYVALGVPVEFGGTAVPPVTPQPDIGGIASANLDITPLLTSGTDTNVETSPGRGTFGFQGSNSSLRVTPDLAQTGVTTRIQEGVDALASVGTLVVATGSYTGDVNTTTKTVDLSAGASPGLITVTGNFTLDGNDTLPVEINGLTAGTGYDQWVVNGTVSLGGATLSLSGSHVPLLGQTFSIVENDDSDVVTGTFNGLPEGALISNFFGSAFFGKVSYVGGSGNDVTLTVVSPEIFVTGNSFEIVAGDPSPENADGTNFGSTALAGGSVTRTFSISNTGSSPLNLTGTAPNYVTLSGTGAAHFSISTQPVTPVAPLIGTTTFTVTFDPSTAGAKTAKVRILNDDLDESVYEFDIVGEGIVTPDLFYTNGFESNTSDWNANAVRVASGTGGISSANGAYHAVSSATSPFTLWGGYNFGAGNAVPTAFREYRTAVSIYLNVGGGWANNTRFDFDSAINNSGGTHRRDFIFNGGFYNDATGPGANTNRFVISASTNSQPSSAFAKNPANDPIAISTSGWYTFEHHFYNNSGVLAVDLLIRDSLGALVKKWTLSDPSDLIANIGGNRYGWFDFNQFSTLAFDDAELTFFPEIAVELAGNVDVPDGSSLDLGLAPFRGVIDTTFTIKNTGIADLKNLAITIDGPGASFFSVFTPPVPPVSAPSGQTTFVLRFSAGSPGGVKNAVVHIANNDRNEAPFDIQITAEAPYSAGLSGGNLVLTDSNAGNTNDHLVLSLSGSNLRIYDANNPLVAGPGTTQIDANTLELPIADITGEITFNGISGNDVLTVNLSTGNPLPSGGISFNGGSGNDALRVVGNGQSVVYTPDAAINGNGSIEIGGRLLAFTGLEPIDFVGLALTLNLPGANDIVDLANGFLIDGSTPATVISGTSAGVGFENARVSNSSITINTTGVAGTDTITVTSANNAHLNTSLTLTTGTEAGDLITINGTTTVTGTTTLNARTITLNANVTNAVSGTVATVVNVDDPGQIADAVAVALAGATVNVLSGTYVEYLTINKSIDLRGPNYGISPNGGVRVAEAVLVPPTTDMTSGNLLTITASNVSVNGLTLDGDNTTLPDSGVGLGGAFGTSMDAFRGVFVSTNGLTGISVAKNIVKNFNNDGIRMQQGTNYFASGPPAVFSSGNSIADNLVKDILVLGIDLRNSMYVSVTNNVVSNARYGIYINSYRIADQGIAANRVISGNTISARQWGVWFNLFHASPYALTNNSITAADPAATEPARTAWFGVMYSTVSAPQNFTNQPNLPLVVTPEFWSASNNTIDGSALDVGTTGYGYWLFYVDNNRDASSVDHFGTISGGSVTGVSRGVFLTNRDTDPATSFGTAAVGAHASVSGVSIAVNAGGTGISLRDSTSWTSSNPAPLINKRDVKLNLGSGVTVSGGAKGLVIEQAFASIVGSSLNNIAFSGQSGNYIELVSNPTNLDATSVSFDSLTGATATVTQNFAIEDKLLHKIDHSALGLLRVKTGELFVTANSFSAPATTVANIQRAVDAASLSEIIQVQTGSYTGNVDTSTKAVTLAAGASPGQVILAGNLTLDSNDTLPVEINGLSAGTGFDQWVVQGTVSLGDATLSLSGSHVPLLGQTFVLVENDDSDVVTGIFNGLSDGALIDNFFGSLFSAAISYSGDSGNDIVLTVVTPEITVFDGATIASPQILDGQPAAIAFGSTTTTSSIVRSFTIQNLGTSILTGISVASTNPLEFSVNSTTTATSLAPNAFTSFTVTFVPVTAGLRNAVINITSNDINENPFNYDVSGIGLAVPVTSPAGDVVSGGGAPDATGADSGTKFDFLRRGGALAENGHFVFPGNLIVGIGGVTSIPNNYMGLWKEDGSGLKLFVRSGTIAPETTGAFFDQLPAVPAINDSGEVTLLATLRSGSGNPVTTLANDTGLWSELGGAGLSLLMREGDPVPGISGAFVGSFASGAYATAHTGASTGEATFSVIMKGSTTDTAILRTSITGPTVTAVQVVARQNTTAPGTSDIFTTLAGSFSDPQRMDATGNLVFSALTTSSKEGIWYQPVSGATDKVFITGETAPGTSGATFRNIKSPAIGSGGVITFRGFLNLNGDNATNLKNDGIWRGVGSNVASYNCILRRGDVGLPGMPVGSKVGNMWHSWLTNANHGAWISWLDVDGNGTSSAPTDVYSIFTDLSGTMSMVLKVGDPAPGIAGATIFSFDLPIVGGQEQYVFLGKVTGGGTTNADNQGVWRSAPNGGALSLIIRTGDSMTTTEGVKIVQKLDFPGSNTTARRWEQPVMDSAGRVLIFATFTDGSSTQILAP